MKKNVCFLIAATILFGLAGWLNQFDSTLTQPAAARAAETCAAQPKQQPVVDSMHQLMEYVFELPYERLKKQMAEEPKDKSGWKIVKSDSLILAEAENLLLMRAPEEDSQEWNNLSVATRDLGGRLYQAARGHDYKAARQHYNAMVAKCNACHTKFADGEHQLEP